METCEDRGMRLVERIRFTIAVLLVAGTACAGRPPAAAVAEGDAVSDSDSGADSDSDSDADSDSERESTAYLPPGAPCPEHELRFTQATGCRNDGSVEFCLGDADASEKASLLAIAPGLRCARGSSGRAGCDSEREALCLLELDESDCVARHGAMTHAAFERVCAIARLDAVRAIVPTWYE